MADNNIENLDSLLKKMKTLSSLMPTLEKVVRTETLRVQGDAKSLCPVDSGDLRMNILTDVKKTGDSVEGIVYNNLEYAPYVEFGTGPKGDADHAGISPNVTPSYRQSGWTYYDEKQEKFIHTTGQAAQPFMYPALKNNEQIIEKNIQTTIKKAIDEASK